MRGIVTQEVNNREFANVDSRIIGYFPENSLVEIADTTTGDDIDGEDLWYRLRDGSYLWSGAVNIETDCSALSEQDRLQFLINYRLVDKDEYPDIVTNEVPDKLTFSTLFLPADPDKVQVSEMTEQQFADTVLQSVLPLKGDAKNVVIYIHGYQLFHSMKLGLLENFVQNYMVHSANKIAKVLFFSWPSQGGPSRKFVDDRSLRAGHNFTANNLFSYFKILSTALEDNGMHLNLVVHSFGHQLLNGMLNPTESTDSNKIPATPIFKNIFLMAPDVTQLCIQKNGRDLENNYWDIIGGKVHYDFTRLNSLASSVHVFYDMYDYLLYISSKKFLTKKILSENDFSEISPYFNLGNFGNEGIRNDSRQPGFNFYNVQDLLDPTLTPNYYNYPYRPVKRRIRKDMESARTGNFSSISGVKHLLRMPAFANRHRYLFTCKEVVDKVQQLLT